MYLFWVHFVPLYLFERANLSVDLYWYLPVSVPSAYIKLRTIPWQWKRISGEIYVTHSLGWMTRGHLHRIWWVFDGGHAEVNNNNINRVTCLPEQSQIKTEHTKCWNSINRVTCLPEQSQIKIEHTKCWVATYWPQETSDPTKKDKWAYK